ncbi:uncharacterized protein EI90DRAFT_3043742 [Cantharellus anzutake]|uniref:uncharacterized protein n=1 Tax=Cantharellus anzutake TaxID=1750568 RepID=UPI00190621E5|nr:uncharacterized protein EI90DRAFT_3043742 [Cantharellus anzutake]KAF8336818.1 hypothetical protein EI90DRAFT_3043742 [Cantharellus anzutake]
MALPQHHVRRSDFLLRVELICLLLQFRLILMAPKGTLLDHQKYSLGLPERISMSIVTGPHGVLCGTFRNPYISVPQN